MPTRWFRSAQQRKVNQNMNKTIALLEEWRMREPASDARVWRLEAITIHCTPEHYLVLRLREKESDKGPERGIDYEMVMKAALGEEGLIEQTIQTAVNKWNALYKSADQIWKEKYS